MALPGRPGPPTAQEAPLVAAKHTLIIKLRDGWGTPWDELAKLTEYSIEYIKTIYYRHHAREQLRTTLEEQQAALIADLDMVTDRVRPWVVGEETPTIPPPHPDFVREMRALLKLKAEAMGSMAPKLTEHHDALDIEVSVTDQRASRIATLTKLLSKTEFGEQPVFDVSGREVRHGSGIVGELPPDVSEYDADVQS